MRVASVPSGHPYVRALTDPDTDDGVSRLPDPPVAGAPPGRWWPPPMLEPSWVRANAAAFDVLHVHFGFDDRTPAELAALVAALRGAGRPLVLTVHDLRNPHHDDPAAHDAALDVLVPAADGLLTLTPGAAADIARRWRRRAVVVPHPPVVPARWARRPRPARSGFVVGVHAKSVRRNADPVGVARALSAAVDGLDGARVRVDAHDDERGRAAARAVEGLPHVEVRVHPPFDDDELYTYLQDLDLSVLPHRWGTHSGWLEVCHDLGTPVLAPDVGHYAGQAPCLTYRRDGSGPDTGPDTATVAGAVRYAYRTRPVWRRGAADRRARRRDVAAAHAALYHRVRAAVPA